MEKVEKVENHKCYILGFENGYENKSENESENPKFESACAWSINAYESYILGYKDGIIFKNALIHQAKNNK